MAAETRWTLHVEQITPRVSLVLWLWSTFHFLILR